MNECQFKAFEVSVQVTKTEDLSRCMHL